MNKNKKNNPSPPMTPRREPDNRRMSILPAQPVLRFTPTAWAKLLCMRDADPVEVGGFAITSPDDLLRVEEFVTVKQRVTVASVAFDDDVVADFFDRQIDAGRKPQQFLRVWLHTHPGDSASPSSTDEETFARVFGNSDWAVMFILARGGQTYARLRFNVGPGGHVQIPLEVDFRQPFAASDQPAWKEEYKANVHPEPILPGMFGVGGLDELDQDLLQAEPFDLADQDLPWEPWQ